MPAAEPRLRQATLAVVGPDGAPHAQRVWCVALPGLLYVAMSPLSPAAQHLRDDWRVSLLLEGAGGDEETVHGTAELVADNQEAGPILAALATQAPEASLLFWVLPTGSTSGETGEDPANRRLTVQHLFSTLVPTVVRTMAHRLRYDTYAAGAVVIRQDSTGDTFFIVVDGEVDVIDEHNSGGPRVLTTLGPGESFGEAALLLNTPRTATVVARTALRVLSVDKHTFDQALLLTDQGDPTKM